jgi:hypothetical protein
MLGRFNVEGHDVGFGNLLNIANTNKLAFSITLEVKVLTQFLTLNSLTRPTWVLIHG